MNKHESCVTTSPSNKSEECAKFIIDDIMRPFTLYGVTSSGLKYTFCFWVRSDNAGSLTIQGTRYQTTAEWAKYIVKYTAAGTDLQISFDTVGTYYIYHPKLEEGNKESSWTKAPEDIDEDVAGVAKRVTMAEASFQLTAETITGRVSNVEGKASTLEQTAERLNYSVEDAAKTAKNFMEFSSDGFVIGDMTASTLGNNVLIHSAGVDIRNGETVLAQYKDREIHLGVDSDSSAIYLCSGAGVIYSEVVEDGLGTEYSTLHLYAENGLNLFSEGDIIMGSSYTYGNNFYQAHYLTDTVGSTISLEMVARMDYPGSTGYAPQRDEGRIYIDPDIIQMWSHSYTGSGAELKLNGISGSVDVTGDLYVSGHIIPTKDLKLSNGYSIFCNKTNGEQVNMMHVNSSDNCIIGYGSYVNNLRTHIYGGDVFLYSTSGSVRPYYKPGDSINITYRGGGFCTSGGNDVHFTVALSKPMVGVSSVAVTSGSGLTIRQNEKYLYGSSGSTAAKPNSYTVYVQNVDFLGIAATFGNATNVTNNSALGVVANINITFS